MHCIAFEFVYPYNDTQLRGVAVHLYIFLLEGFASGLTLKLRMLL
jgi:hypothetical protein